MDISTINPDTQLSQSRSICNTELDVIMVQGEERRQQIEPIALNTSQGTLYLEYDIIEPQTK